MTNLHKIIYSLLSLLLGIVFVWLIIYSSPITLKEIYFKLKYLQAKYIFLIILTTFINFSLLAYRWKLVITRINLEVEKKSIFYLFYIALGAVLGIVIPRQISLLSVQSFAIKYHKLSSLSNGFVTAIYNQLFNILIPLLMLLPTLLFTFNAISLSISILLCLTILFTTPYLLKRWQKPLLSLLIKTYFRCQKLIPKYKNSYRNHNYVAEISILEPKFTIRLYWLTIFMHINLIVRSFCVVMSAGLNIKFWLIALGSPLIYLAMILSFTPGNLGLMEWSWIGVLEIFHVSAENAASFAILQRILFTLSIIFIFFCISLTMAITKFIFLKKIV